MTPHPQTSGETAQAADIGKSTGNKKPRRRTPDGCVPVHCRKCDKYLATLMPKAEILCQDCSTPNRWVWTEAVAPAAESQGARKMRKWRAKKAA